MDFKLYQLKFYKSLEKILLAFASAILILSCKEQKQQNYPQSDLPVLKRMEMPYMLVPGKDSIKKIISGFDSAQKRIIFSTNRTDAQNFSKLDTVLIPSSLK